MAKVLRPHQDRALDYGLDRDHPAWFMEMRLGKTLVSIRWAQLLKARRILVVAPLTVLQSWERELAEEGEKYVIAYGLGPTQREVVADYVTRLQSSSRVWVLVNYEGLRVEPAIGMYPWDIVIWDESTRLKNPQAQVTQISRTCFREVKHRALLTGLPNPESALDFFCQFSVLHNTFMGCRNYWEFRETYFKPGYHQGHWIPLPGTEERIKEAVHSKAFILSRKDAGMKDTKVYQRRDIPCPPKIKKLMKQGMEDMSIGGDETQWAMVMSNWLGRLADGYAPDGTLISDHKFREFESLVTDELRNEKVVGWFRNIDSLEMQKARLQKMGIPCAAMWGDTPVHRRKEIVTDFNRARGGIRVVLIQETLGKFGLDLSKQCSTAVYWSNTWSCEDRVQSEDRILDVGKEDPLLYIDLVTRDTADEDLVAALRDKKLESHIMLRKLRDSFERRSGMSAQREGVEH